MGRQQVRKLPSFLQQSTHGDASPEDTLPRMELPWRQHLGATSSPPHEGTAEEDRAHLVEDEGLADVAPRAAGREVVESEEEEEEEAQAR